jgi:acetate kinase
VDILIFNCGSSSLNFKIYSTSGPGPLQVIASGKAHRVGVKGSEPSFMEMRLPDDQIYLQMAFPDHRTTAGIILDQLQASDLHPDLIGHRFVHGGSEFQHTVWVDAETLPRLEACLPLASIHNPNSMSVIRICMERLGRCRQFVTFDTDFHAGLPESAAAYLLPRQMIDGNGYRKYGFHGLSYRYVSRAASDYLGVPLNELNLIACHLGTGGSSASAIHDGQSLDTTMGFSPLAGLMMSTRPGDLDAGLFPYWLSQGKTPSELESFLNKKSGLLGVSGISSDIRDLQASSDTNARLAVEMYYHRLKKAIGGLAVEIGRLDALIFTDDIGEQNWQMREAVCREMEWCGIWLDQDANRSAIKGHINRISSTDSPVAVLAMPTDEEAIIAREGLDLWMGEARG